jgi:PIN domain nuclease of toxin-antitoxin system
VKRYVLDASALMLFFADGPGAGAVQRVVDLAIDGDAQLLMSVVNWGEIYYATWRDRGQRIASRIVDEIAKLPVEIEDANYEATRMAAELKAQFGLPYADCFAASLAHRKDAPVLTADADFKAVKALIAVQFI